MRPGTARLYAGAMSYKPSPPGPAAEPWEWARRTEDASQSALTAADIIGCSEEEARKRVEAAGLTFRRVRAGGVRTADLALARVTATIVDGRVRDARVG